MPGGMGMVEQLAGPLSSRRNRFKLAIQHDCPLDPEDCGGPLVDLDGYRVYWGPAPGNYTNSVTLDGALTSYLVEGLSVGTWYFAATAVNASAVESTFSNVASKTIL